MARKRKKKGSWPRRAGSFRPYTERDSILRNLGYATYRAYLDSDLWATIRQKVLERDGHKCFACRRAAKQVHHTKYTPDVMLGVDITSLRSLCGGCHVSIELFPDNSKKTPHEANRHLRRRRKRITKNILWETSPEYRQAMRLKNAEQRLFRLDKTRSRERLNDLRRQLRQLVRQDLEQQGQIANGSYTADKR